MKGLFEKLNRTLRQGEPAVLVSIVASSGSTPRREGAHMLIAREGHLAGTIGGGAVEYKAEAMAAEVLEKGTSKMQAFTLRKNEIQDLGMVCGGDVSVYFTYIAPGEPAVLKLTEEIAELYRKNEEAWLVMDISTDGCDQVGVYGKYSGMHGMTVPQEVPDALSFMPVRVTAGGRTWYAEKLIRSGSVYIFGGGHVAQALVPILSSVDFHCIVAEDREEFLDPKLFKGLAETIRVDNEHVLDTVHITENDYVCIMTRGHKADMIIESQMLSTAARYIGVIGSRHKIAAVSAQLKEKGWTDRDLERITTPIGLDIKAETPAEIAVSITAQLIEKRASVNESIGRI